MHRHRTFLAVGAVFIFKLKLGQLFMGQASDKDYLIDGDADAQTVFCNVKPDFTARSVQSGVFATRWSIAPDDCRDFKAFAATSDISRRA
jgi:hypothetical protein